MPKVESLVCPLPAYLVLEASPKLESTAYGHLLHTLLHTDLHHESEQKESSHMLGLSRHLRPRSQGDFSFFH